MFRDILGVGAVAAVTSIQTNVTIALATAMVAVAAGRDAVAGFGTGARLEYLLVPLVFGFGAPLVALVGTNVGAGQRERAVRIALIGGSIAFAITEAIGIAAALWPQAWLGLFSTDAQVIEDRQRLSAHRRTLLRVLRPWACAVLLFPGRGPAVVAAGGGLAADGCRLDRRMAGAAVDRITARHVCRARGRSRSLRPDHSDRSSVGRMVPRAARC